MSRLATLLLSLAVLLGGCINSSDPGAEQPGAAVEPAATKGDPAPAGQGTASSANASSPPPASTSGSANRTSAPTATPNATAQEPAAPAAPRTAEVAGEGKATLAAATPCEVPEPVPPFCGLVVDAEPVELAFPEPGPTAALLTVTWEAKTPATDSMSFEVTDAEGAVLATGAGASPLANALPADLLAGLGAVVVHVAPSAPGAVVEQTYDLLLALTYGG